MKYNKRLNKSVAIIALSVLILLTFAACNDTSHETLMYIEKAKLTEQEENIAKLLGLNTDQLIYDFKLDDTVQSIQVNTYELKNGEWHMIVGGGGQAFDDTQGRLALSFENLAEGLRVALQSERGVGSNKYSTESIEDIESMSRTASILSDKTNIIYEKEVPLVIQIMTTQNSVSSYDVEFFYQPEKYTEHGYEHVHAVTILFSQKTVSELSGN